MPPILSAAGIVWRRREEPEVLLARRRPRMRFFGGVYAFCGGRVDPVDRQVAGPDQDPTLVLRSTLARELLEETGLDLRTGRAADPRLVRRLREDAAAWAGNCDRGELAGLPRPCMRLVTPEFYPRRFDTWFSVVEADTGFEPDFCDVELDGGRFDPPEVWLGRWRAGEFHLAPPTVLQLRVLANHDPSAWEPALRGAQDRVEDPSTVQEIRTDPAVRLLPLRTPTLPPARHTNAYLVGHRHAWLVDPASPWPREQDQLLATLREVSAAGGSLQGVVLTHHHADHVGAARRVAESCGVGILAHPETARRLAGRVAVTREIDEGETLGFGHEDGAPGRLRVLHTPGHAPGHLCLLETRYRGLIAGDMVSTLSSILVDPEDGDMGDYLRSLERLAELEPACVYPAHGPADTAGGRVLRDQLDHRRERADAVLAAVRQGPVGLDELTARVWGDVPRPMLGYASKSAVSILRHLGRLGELDWDGHTARPV